MNLRPVLYVIGLFLMALAKLMLLPVVYDLLTGQTEIWNFIEAAGITAITGITLSLIFHSTEFQLKSRHIFLITNSCWLTLSLFAALPLWLKLDISYTDAFSDQSEDSLWKSRIAPTFKNGSTATAVTINPIPPNHCNMERQSRTSSCMVSSPVRTVEPVVVTPDMVSKKHRCS